MECSTSGFQSSFSSLPPPYHGCDDIKMSGIHLIPIPASSSGTSRRLSLCIDDANRSSPLLRSPSLSPQPQQRSPAMAASPSLAPSPIIPPASPSFFGRDSSFSHEHGRHRSSLDGFTSPNIAAPAKRLSTIVFAEEDDLLSFADRGNSSLNLTSRAAPVGPSTPQSRVTDRNDFGLGLGFSGVTTSSYDGLLNHAVTEYSDVEGDETSEEGSPLKYRDPRHASPFYNDSIKPFYRPSPVVPSSSSFAVSLPRASYIPPPAPETPRRSSRFDRMASWLFSPSSSDQSPLPSNTVTPTRYRYHVFPISPSLLRPHPRRIHGQSSSSSRSTRFIFFLCIVASTYLVWRRSLLNAEFLSSTDMELEESFVPLPRPEQIARPIAAEPRLALPLNFAFGRKHHPKKMSKPKPTPTPVDAKKMKLAKEAEKKKFAKKYDRILAAGKPPRRHVYGANYQGDSDDENAETNLKRVKLPTHKELKKKFESDKKHYEMEKEGWNEFEWKAPEVESTLQQFVNNLSDAEWELREWIRKLHRGVDAIPIGLARNSSSPTLPTAWPKSVPDLGPIPYLSEDRGSVSKWQRLEIMAKSPGDEGMCQTSTWLDGYAKMHRETLNGKRKPRFISYHCETGMNCGGAADRLLGLTSTFFMGLVTDRAFVAEWQSPVPLEIVFDAPRVDWSYSSFSVDQHPIFGDREFSSQAKDLDIVHFDRHAMDKTFKTKTWRWDANRDPKDLQPGFEQRDLAFQSPWIKMYTNRGMITRSFGYPHLRSRLEDLGLDPLNAFACISNYLFKPKPAALDLISTYSSILALPSVFSVGIQIRTGDESMRSTELDKLNTVFRHSDFFRCASELAATYASPSQRVVYYLVTDSAHLKLDAARVLGDSLITTEMKPQHVHVASSHHAVDGVMGAVVEYSILGKTDMRVVTEKSGFGKLAAFASGDDASTVTVLSKHSPEAIRSKGRHPRVNMDCTRPEALTSFEDLSSDWSLG